MPPAFVGETLARPFIVHVEEVILATIVDQSGGVSDMALDRGVVELRPQGLIVILLIGNLFRGEIRRVGLRSLGESQEAGKCKTADAIADDTKPQTRARHVEVPPSIRLL